MKICSNSPKDLHWFLGGREAGKATAPTRRPTHLNLICSSVLISSTFAHGEGRVWWLQNKINWVERILQVFKCAWRAMSERRRWNECKSNEIKYKKHIFSPYRSISSFLTQLQFGKPLFFVFYVFQQRTNHQLSPYQEAALEGVKSR